MKILKKRSHKKEIIFSKNDFNVIFIRLHFKRKKKKGLRSEILLSKEDHGRAPKGVVQTQESTF